LCLSALATEKGGSGKLSDLAKWVQKKLTEYLEGAKGQQVKAENGPKTANLDIPENGKVEMDK